MSTQINYPAHMRPFKIYIKKVVKVKSCEEKINQEKRGMFGFHRFTDCPHCVKTNEGFELWGENHFMQAQLKELYDREEMIRNFTKTYTYPEFVDTNETLYYEA